ncbi:GGDEF domain-containing protein [uncultured Methylibium sp.]|uniref:GGDEF domain-containing protein n=1 Tax=uncultured Methylibium sp. TaxID=381093 RepID=UPI0025FAB623|nr:GGDEF domain-containing protein [uncultured Methylibium sp.]
MTPSWRRRVAVGLLVAASSAGAATPSAPLPGSETLVALDAAQRAVASDPDIAAQRLRLLTVSGAPAQRALAWWLLDGLHESRHDAAAARAAAELLSRDTEPLLRSVGALVRARLAREAGQLDVAGREARQAMNGIEQAYAEVRPGVLDDALRAEAFRMLGSITGALGQLEDGMRQLRTARHLARALHDAPREALALDEEARLLADYGYVERAQAAQGEAWRLLQGAAMPEPALQARLLVGQLRLALQRGQHELGKLLAQRALAKADEADARLLRGAALTLGAQALRLAAEPATARRSAEAALAAVAELPADAPQRRSAQAQLGLARIALGQTAAGRQEVEEALRLGPTDTLAEALLRQLDEALAAAGDARSALEVFHRERALHDARLARERAVVLGELQARHDSARQQRSVEALNRGNALKAAELEQRALQQRALWLAALVVALALAVLVLLYRRVRRTRSQLAARQAQLRDLSERDPLTRLANRRHFQTVMKARGLDGVFEGAVLLLDIDHFKRINDEHGHAAGDAVLAEVARRIERTARNDDLIVRWGGEEFLVVSLKLPPARLPALALRLLRAIGAEPVDTPAGPLSVTASIGHARFPLPGCPPIGWERALQLADGALYLAKRQGRHRAVGIERVQAPDDAALRAIEQDLEAAVQDGRAELLRLEGAPRDGGSARAAPRREVAVQAAQ